MPGPSLLAAQQAVHEVAARFSIQQARLAAQISVHATTLLFCLASAPQRIYINISSMIQAHCAAASIGCSSPAAARLLASARRCWAPRLRAAPRCAAAAEAPAAATEPVAPYVSAIQPYPDPFPGLQPGDDLADEYGHPGPNPPKHRRAGVILHPTSLPGKYGMGEIGGEAFRFVDWLVETGMQLWQVSCALPILALPLASPPLTGAALSAAGCR